VRIEFGDILLIHGAENGVGKHAGIVASANFFCCGPDRTGTRRLPNQPKVLASVTVVTRTIETDQFWDTDTTL